MTSIVERLILAALALIGASAVIVGWNYGDGTAHGGNLMPALSGGMVAVLAVLCVFRGRGAEEQVDPSRDMWKPWVVLAGTAAFLGLMPIIGFPVAAPAWIAGIMFLLGARSVAKIAGTAAFLPIVAYLLLARLAFAPPPMGPFGV